MGEIKEECTSPDKRKVALYSSGESKAIASACETASSLGSIGPELSHLRWGMWYKLRELEAATNGLCEENVNGEGGYGSVYRGLFPNGTKVAGDLDLICPKNGLSRMQIALWNKVQEEIPEVQEALVGHYTPLLKFQSNGHDTMFNYSH